MNEKPQENQDFVNPIDADKVTETPSTLTYAHHRGSVAIKPEDRGKIKSKALSSMYQQTDLQLTQIYKQMELLVEQTRKLQARKEISERIYHAEMGFEPLVGMTYYLYLRKSGKYLLSIVAPEEWGGKLPFEKHVATVRLLADHTWDIIAGGLEEEAE